jgi:hypothetical protein
MAYYSRTILLTRVRTLSCDGRRIGKTRNEEFFFDVDDAMDHQKKLIQDSDEKNPAHTFKEEIEAIDGIFGFCNWQFGIMIAVDRIEVKKNYKP